MSVALLEQMPEYRCHKVVRASKITKVIPGSPICLWADVQLLEPAGATVRLSAGFYNMHQPEAGGYLVWYANGHLSYSPEKPFTEGYRRIEHGQKDDPATSLKLDNGTHVSVSGNAITVTAPGGISLSTTCIDLEAADFSDALMWLKEGKKVARKGWNGKGLWLELQRPDEHSKMTLPYIFLSYPKDAITTPGARVPWFPSQTDLLAADWLVIH